MGLMSITKFPPQLVAAVVLSCNKDRPHSHSYTATATVELVRNNCGTCFRFYVDLVSSLCVTFGIVFLLFVIIFVQALGVFG